MLNSRFLPRPKLLCRNLSLFFYPLNPFCLSTLAISSVWRLLDYSTWDTQWACHEIHSGHIRNNQPRICFEDKFNSNFWQMHYSRKYLRMDLRFLAWAIRMMDLSSTEMEELKFEVELEKKIRNWVLKSWIKNLAPRRKVWTRRNFVSCWNVLKITWLLCFFVE